MPVNGAIRVLATLGMLSFVLSQQMHGQTTTTNTDCSLNGNTANCRSTSTSDAAEIAQQQEQQAERDKQLNEMGNAIGVSISNAMLRHKVKKGVEKYCGQHPGEPWTWQVDGQTLSGICPGELPLALARRQLTDSIASVFAKDGVAGYSEFSGDTLIIHSERASAMRFHAQISDPRKLAAIRAVRATKFVYTNDAGQRFEYDAVAGHEVTSTVATSAATPAAGTVSPSPETPTPCPAGTVRMPIGDGGGCK